MKIIDKLKAKNTDLFGAKAVTIAFLGDSVTQGCFECYFDENGVIQTVFDTKSAYPTRVKEILNIIYPSAQINIINAGISGDNAVNGNARFERDIASHSPDLVVVAFGLNDSCSGNDVKVYTDALESIFAKVKAIGSECIFLFQNMMNTKVSCHLKEDRERELAKGFVGIQNGGTLDKYHDAAKEIALKCGVAFCDIYSAWKKMAAGGVDITDMLANYYNHPKREFHYYTAIKVVEKMFE